MEEDNINQRNDNYYSIDPTPLNEILGAAPGWLLRSGIGIIALIVFLLLIGSMLFSYPDIIEAPVVISADNPPINLVAVNSGKIERIFKKEGEYVEKGELIAVTESPLFLDDVLWLRSLILTEASNNNGASNETFIPSSENLPHSISLGPLQNAYNDWLTSLQDYEQFEWLNYHNQKIAQLQNQLSERDQLELQLQRKSESFARIYELSKRNYLRDSTLAEQNFISPVDFERSESDFFSRRISLEDYQSQLIQLKVQKNDIRSILFETTTDYTQKQSEHLRHTRITFENLKSQLTSWEKNYAFVAPVSGELVLSGVWVEHQQVNGGDLVFSLVPSDYGQFIVRGTIPLRGSGKVKKKDRVNIRLSNYPYQEYGVLQGEIVHISTIPSNEKYTIQIKLQNGLQTSYNINLGHHVMLDGVAQIITEDISLFNRMMNPLRSLSRNR